MRFRPWILALAVGALAQPVAPAVQDPAARVDQVFKAFDKKDSPGCALGVYRDGKIAYARGYGMADLQKDVPITTSTIFDIGSTSKQFTAASVLLLAQRGKLSLDDDVRRFIPELPTYQKPITIRHLLHHTSGLRDYIGLLTLAGHNTDGHTTARQALDAIVRQKALNFEPGAEYLYSNSGYFLMSQIVERASRQTLRAFAQQNIFDPLGMKSTHIHDSYRMAVPKRAIGYGPDEKGAGFVVDMSNWEQTGDGAVFTTVDDLLLWDQNFYTPKVGGQALLAELQTRGTLNDSTPLPYARGLQIGTFRGLNTVSHGGSWAGFRAELLRFPEQRFSVAVLCNLATSNPSAKAREVAAIYLEDKLTPLPTPPAGSAPGGRSGGVPPGDVTPVSAGLLRSYAGKYYSEELNTTYTVEAEAGTVAIVRDGAPRLVMRAMPDGTFRGGGITIRFVPSADGRSPGFELGLGRVRGITFVRRQA